jgi:hypothetical protein
MSYKIDILSPGKSCWKTQKIIRFLQCFVRKYDVDAEINVVTGMNRLLTYRTWILPTVFVNGKPVARGYRPSEKTLLKLLKPQK